MIVKILTVLFTWLGIESLLAIYCLQYGMTLLLIPASRYDSLLTTDLAWQGYGLWLGIPFLVKSVFTGSGVITNLQGQSYSWLLRFIGASVGSMIWIAMSLKYYSSVGLSFGFFVSIDCFILSLFIVVMSYHDFPEPGGITNGGLR